MRENLSTNTLFHFTRSLENLLSILQHGLAPSYSMEDLSVLDSAELPGVRDRFAIPMTCFCDIPLSQAGAHMATYGPYGIGLGKPWGIQVGVAPVQYIIPNTPTATALRELIIEAIAAADEPEGHMESAWPHIEQMLCSAKPYEGVSSVSGETIRFYDEREWRFLPRDEDGSIEWRTESGYLEEVESGAIANPPFHGAALALPVGDVRYLLVRDDSEVLTVMSVLEAIGGEVLSMNEMRLLQSRIISARHIAEDF